MRMKKLAVAAVLCAMVLCMLGAAVALGETRVLYREDLTAVALCDQPRGEQESYPLGIYLGGTQTQVLSPAKSGWIQVSIGGDGLEEGIRGYVREEYAVGKREVPGDLPAPAGVMRTDSPTGFVSLFNEAREASKVVALYPAGTDVTVLGDLGNWLHVQVGKAAGFVRAEQVQLDSETSARLNKAAPTYWENVDPARKKLADSLADMRAEKEAGYGVFGKWPMEEKAWYSQMRQDMGLATPDEDMYILPREGDLPEEEAMRIAIAGLDKAYILSEKELSSLDLGVGLKITPSDPGKPVWVIEYYVPDREDAEYSVTVQSPSGDILVLRCGRVEDRFVRLIGEKGPIHTWTREEQANWGWMEREAGYGVHTFVYGKPEKGDMTEEKAIEKANEALAKEYGEKALREGKPYAALNVMDRKAPIWRIQYWADRALYPTYEVTMAARGKTVVHVKRLDGVQKPSSYEQMTAWDKEKGPFHRWSLEDKALMAEWHGLPGEEHITREEALEKALAALQVKFGFTDAQLRKFIPNYAFIIDDSWIEAPYWQIDFEEKTSGVQELNGYAVYINPTTGDIIRAFGPEDANG